MAAYPLTALVTLFALAVTLVLVFNVGRARMKHKVQPPSFDGPPEFLRIHRAHQNTLESLPLFVPLVWMAALTLGDLAAAAIGVFWPVGRILYAAGYYAEAGKRMPGFLLSLLVLLALWVATLVSVLWRLIQG